eukprot:5682989-Alexandrium_andersonii.AAC.1
MDLASPHRPRIPTPQCLMFSPPRPPTLTTRCAPCTGRGRHRNGVSQQSNSARARALGLGRHVR